MEFVFTMNHIIKHVDLFLCFGSIDAHSKTGHTCFEDVDKACSGPSRTFLCFPELVPKMGCPRIYFPVYGSTLIFYSQPMCDDPLRRSSRHKAGCSGLVVTPDINHIACKSGQLLNPAHHVLLPLAPVCA